jgi:putative peptidoglycan lipid II flippase
VVNQVAYTVVVRLASGGTAAGANGTGYTVYSNAFLLVMVPHSIITVSLATAVLPRLSGYAAAGDLRAVASTVNATMRSTFALVLPLLALIPVIAPDLVNIVWAYGSAKHSASNFVPSVSLFAIGLFFFTSHYLVLRGFYALEQNRRVFVIQCVIAAINIVAAVLLTRHINPVDTAPRLVIAYTISYAVGAALSFRQLSVRTSGLGGRELVRFAVRILVVTGIATGLAWLTRVGLDHSFNGTDKFSALIRLGLMGGVGMGSYLVLARLFRLNEVTEVTQIVTGRIRPNR